MDCTPLTSHMDPNSKLSAHDLAKLNDALLYCKSVGSLTWLLNNRLDLHFSVKTLISFMQKPLHPHWLAGLRVICYLKGTLQLASFMLVEVLLLPPSLFVDGVT